MKSSIKFSAIVAIMAFGSIIAFAQAQRGNKVIDPNARAERQTTRMAEKLELDEAQVAKVGEINLAFAQEMSEFHQNNEEKRKEVREARKSLEEGRIGKLKEILTADQFNSYEEMKADAGKRRRHGGDKDRHDREK